MQAHFINQADLQQLPDGRNFQTLDAFAFFSPRHGLITVPKHFKTDLASIPRLFWNILPPFGKYTDAAIVHDYLYRTQLLPRAVCDSVLLEAMRVSRVRWLQRQVIYWNVLFFGGIAWDDNSRHIAKPATNAVDHDRGDQYGGRHYQRRGN